MSRRLFGTADGARVLVVERLSLGEVGVRTENEGGPKECNGVILDNEALRELILALLDAAWSLDLDPIPTPDGPRMRQSRKVEDVKEG